MEAVEAVEAVEDGRLRLSDTVQRNGSTFRQKIGSLFETDGIRFRVDAKSVKSGA